MSVFLYHCYESQVAKTYPRTPLPPVTKPRRDRASLEFFYLQRNHIKGFQCLAGLGVRFRNQILIL